MKRVWSIAIVLALISMASVGVMAKETIVWWYENATPEQESALLDNFVKVFNVNNPETQLVVRFDPNMDANVRSAMLAGSGPDLVMTPGVGYAQQFIVDDYLLPLDSYAEKYGWFDRFLPIMIELGSFDGHLYALPKTYESMILFYNKTLFEEHGWKVPTNRAELDDIIGKMVEKGITPFAQGNADWRGNNEHYVGVFLNHYAGPENVYKALKGELAWNDPVFVEAIALLNDFYQKGYFGEDYFSLGNEDFVTLMAMGEAGMSIIGTWGFQWMNPIFGMTGQDWDWAPFPALRDGVEYPFYDLGIGTTLSINAKSKNPDATAAALDMLTGDKTVIAGLNRDWPGEWNMPLTDLDADDFEGVVDHRYARHIEEVADAVEEGLYGYTTWTFWPQKTMQYIIEGIEVVWLGQLTPEQYLSKVNEIFQEELKDGAVPPIPAR